MRKDAKARVRHDAQASAYSGVQAPSDIKESWATVAVVTQLANNSFIHEFNVQAAS